ncbi:hypothetical protein CK203_048001 [Vitis vinifera]|uniref:Nucleotide exchange factor Fes1 domain-containing protein n=1 Tax=Vitis vinifera TaxID=29760 RepID=A0A438GH62_VITVI|nr:hypothetical protein CK203_048001 [Vitis vinifera]
MCIDELAVELGCRVGALPTVYLGLPLGANHKATTMWDGVEKRMRRRLALWKRQYLSKGGRITLMKSTLARGSLERKIHLINWEVVCNQKEKGGLGIRKIDLLNKALLGKWIWRFAFEKEIIWKKVIGVKYDHEGFGWRTNKARGTFGVGVWKEILKETNWCWDNIEFKVGEGTKVNFWTDQWCGELFHMLRDLRISSEEDSVIWKGGGHGYFRIRDAYKLLTVPSAITFPKKSIWVDKELMEKLKMPSDAQLMQIAIADLNNSSLPMEDHHRALQELLILVESIDNANGKLIISHVLFLLRAFMPLLVASFLLGEEALDDKSLHNEFGVCQTLNKLGGLTVVICELDNPDPEIRKTSAWILGKASQNNPVVQKQFHLYSRFLVFEPSMSWNLGALPKLMKMVNSSFVEEATKALYAVSALIRNNLAAQELFYAKAGDLMLQDILSNPSIDIRLRRKTVFLVGDLAECQLESTHKAELPFFSNRHFLKSVVDLTASSDIDLQEKALIAVKNLLQLRTTEALVFKDYCDLDGALERMRKQLQQLMDEEYQRDYVMDLEKVAGDTCSNMMTSIWSFINISKQVIWTIMLLSMCGSSSVRNLCIKVILREVFTQREGLGSASTPKLNFSCSALAKRKETKRVSGHSSRVFVLRVFVKLRSIGRLPPPPPLTTWHSTTPLPSTNPCCRQRSLA